MMSLDAASSSLVTKMRPLTYDADGNLLAHDGWSYTWDGENRLTSVAHNGSVVVSNRYDALHRRVQKITPAATTTFFYDDWNLLREVEVTASGVTNRTDYYWGRDLSGTLQGAGGVGGLVAVSIAGQYCLPCYDNLGNVVAYVSESGAKVAEYTYDAFGNTVSSSGSLRTLFPHRFSTKWQDDYNEFYDYGYRWYWPRIGRWLNRDPIEEEGGENLYSFSENSTLTSIDRYGLSVCETCCPSQCNSGDKKVFDSFVLVLPTGWLPENQDLPDSLTTYEHVFNFVSALGDGISVGEVTTPLVGVSAAAVSFVMNEMSISPTEIAKNMATLVKSIEFKRAGAQVWTKVSHQKCRTNQRCLIFCKRNEWSQVFQSGWRPCTIGSDIGGSKNPTYTSRELASKNAARCLAAHIAETIGKK